MTRDGYIGIGLFLFAVLFWLEANTIPTSFLDTSVTASAIPKALAIAMGFLSLVLVFQGVMEGRKTPAVVTADSKDDKAEGRDPGWHAHKRAIGMLMIGVVYLIALPYLGYILCTALLLGGVAYYNGKRSIGALALFAVLGAIFFYAMFTIALDVQLPRGFLPAF